MKILPDYLIQIMPDIEAAMEELRLSVMDHAYELLQRIDIDELSSSEIRQKLELFNLSVENMTESWLPNGRFYRMYPSIKHYRTTYNAIQSIVRSGGQFEGVWSYDFNTHSEYDCKNLQLLRHYSLMIPTDGYFYISGDASRDALGQVTSSTLTALSSDILLYQALPAGYTYLYIPWPRPHYPSDSLYFYNVHMLTYDRLHYAQDCHDIYSLQGWEFVGDGIYKCDDNNGTNKYYDTATAKYGSSKNNCVYQFDESFVSDKQFHYYSLEVPASYQYYDYTDFRTRTPYWYDYHYMGAGVFNKKPNSKWPINEVGYYVDVDGEIVDDIDEAKSYRLDESCKELADSNAIFPTNCVIHGRYRFATPNRDQRFTPFKPKDYNDPTGEHIEYSIDETYDTSIPASANSDKRGPFRFDYLADDLHMHIFEKHRHVKKFRPIWSEESMNFDLNQSSYYSGLYNKDLVEDSDTSDKPQRSPYHWFNLSQQSNLMSLYGDSYTADTIQHNMPPISLITHTQVRRPTVSRLDPVFVGYLKYDTDEDKHIVIDQGDNLDSGESIDGKLLYYFDESDVSKYIEYDPTLYYTIVGFGSYNDNVQSIDDTDIKAYLEGDPYTKELYINQYGDTHSEINYVLYKTSKVHKLWFTQDKKNISRVNKSLDRDRELYNRSGSTDLIHYTAPHNEFGFAFKVLGIYDENDKPVEYNKNGASISIIIKNLDTYKVSISAVKLGEEPIKDAAYVLFTVNVFPGHVPEITSVDIDLDVTLLGAARVWEHIDLGAVEYDPDAGDWTPPIEGGDYNFDEFVVEEPISGGD